HEEVTELLLRIGDPEQRAVRTADDARIADLAAGFAIERRLIENQSRLLPLLQMLDGPRILDDAADDPLRRLGLVAEELGCADLLAYLEPDGLGGCFAGAL